MSAATADAGTPVTSSRTRARWWKVLAFSSAGLVLLTALVGLAHTPVGRPLLALLQGAPGCPVLGAAASPEVVEEYRIAKLSPGRGATPAVARPALGFSVGTSKREEVKEALSQAGASCDTEEGDSVLRCQKLQTATFPITAPWATRPAFWASAPYLFVCPDSLKNCLSPRPTVP